MVTRLGLVSLSEQRTLGKEATFTVEFLKKLTYDISIARSQKFLLHNKKYVIVEGTIVKTFNSGVVCFLNFDTNYQYFSAVIFASDFPGFSFIPEVFYLGKKVYIIGIIKEYNGSPEIIVKTPDQIKIISKGGWYL
jgi:hypothetical protein